MTWLVIKFDDEDAVEAVPNTWYIDKNSQCYWPPKGTIQHVIIDFIKKKHLPTTDWMLYKASCLGTYDTYKKAHQKANKAKSTNNLASNSEELTQKKRRNMKNKKRNYISESESFSERDISSADDEVYPDPDVLNLDKQIDSINRMKTQIENNTHKNNKARITTISDNITPIANILDSSRKSNSALELNSGEKDEFKKRIFRELHILSLKIDDISEGVNVLLKKKADAEVQKPVCKEIPEIMQSFPVNDNSLVKLEDWLIQSEENKAILSQNLSRIGGCTLKEIVRRIMYCIFTNEVGISYSWEGAKKKKVFKNLAVASVILSAVRLNKNMQECTDSEIICFVKAWLVRSKDRFNNNRDKNIAPQRVETIEDN
ncbi:uncharacterized protein LOC114254085 [Monomorium pharaonis]|uniref:uncharacterized protein LOC114254085 n=1 Tax=Monomorium pharaonis TaxID=307658 RepID=UPI0017466508|nr:uncharacterized protein LOC114254085 [Monomorium pharaonis]XP_036151075.1 uncharacterized protein LOC114254085 [Monomorium pharaonis]